MRGQPSNYLSDQNKGLRQLLRLQAQFYAACEGDPGFANIFVLISDTLSWGRRAVDCVDGLLWSDGSECEQSK